MLQNKLPANRPRLAAVITAIKGNCTASMVDRFLDGYGWNGAYHHPAMDVVSLYVDQKGPGDVWPGPPRPSSHCSSSIPPLPRPLPAAPASSPSMASSWSESRASIRSPLPAS